MFKVKIAIVGCGAWGKNLTHTFFELGVLAAVCDVNLMSANIVAEKYNVPALTFKDIIKNQDINGIVIAAPVIKHYELAKAAIIAKKHVLIEKPISLKVCEAQELYNLAQDNRCILMVGHLLQYHPGFVRLKKIINEGKLGKLVYIDSSRLNLGRFRNEENILWSFAPHDVSMILSLSGELPESVYANGISHINPDIYDIATMHLSFKNGIKSKIFVSWFHPYKEQKLIVVGDLGMAVFDDGLGWNEKLQVYYHKINFIDGLPQSDKADAVCISLEETVAPLKLECKHFIDCIKENNNPITDGLEGIRVLQVLEMADKSLSYKKSITFLKNDYFKHDSSLIDANCQIGKDTKIWHFSHILPNVKIGSNCTIGQNVMIGPNVIVGNNCKIQNNVSLYQGVILEDGVFCGPSCVFTNVINPRAEIDKKDEFKTTHVETGVTIGANATIICGVKLGAYSFIGAGAVVTKDVKPFALVVGNPAKQVGWVDKTGCKLKHEDSLRCIITEYS